MAFTFNLKGWVGLLRAVDRLLELESKHGRLIEVQARRLDELSGRINKLEAREQILIAEAKGAAGAAASMVASQHMSDLARHVGGLDERVRRLEMDGRDPATRMLPQR